MMPAKVAPVSNEPRWQYRLSDLLLAIVLLGFALAFVAPVLEHICGWQEHLALLAAGLATLGGAAAGLARAQWDRRPSDSRLAYIAAYAIGSWYVLVGMWRMGAGFTTLGGLLSLPAVIWALGRSERMGFERFQFEARTAAGLVATASFLTMIAAVFARYEYRMAGNESAAIEACKHYCEAQDIYRRTDWDGDGVLEYAQRITGSNSLYERIAGAADLQLVEPSFAGACAPANNRPWRGYYFKVLAGQGPNAPGGLKSYLTDRNDGQEADMVLGYALVAWPARWNATGRHTFLVNNTGTVYQEDLGPETAKIVAEIILYNPPSMWSYPE